MGTNSPRQQRRSRKVIMRDFAPDGSLIKEVHMYGLLEIGIEYDFRAGTKILETYFCRKKLVGRRTYEKARAKYPNMPEPDTKIEDWGADLLGMIANERKQHSLEARDHRPDPEAAREKDG